MKWNFHYVCIHFLFLFRTKIIFLFNSFSFSNDNVANIALIYDKVKIKYRKRKHKQFSINICAGESGPRECVCEREKPKWKMMKKSNHVSNRLCSHFRIKKMSGDKFAFLLHILFRCGRNSHVSECRCIHNFLFFFCWTFSISK